MEDVILLSRNAIILLTKKYSVCYKLTSKVMNITPLFDNILVEPLEAETKTSSGIYLPDNAKEKPQIGMVKAVGSGKIKDGKLEPMMVKVGEKVMYKKWGGTEVKVDGKEMTIVGQDDILAIVK
jgi:chaperonin GroES